MQVDLRRAERAMSHQILDLISRPVRIRDIASEGVPERSDCPVQGAACLGQEEFTYQAARTRQSVSAARFPTTGMDRCA